jgi:hypothetical protein
MARNLLDPARRVLSPAVQAAAKDFERYVNH